MFREYKRTLGNEKDEGKIKKSMGKESKIEKILKEVELKKYNKLKNRREKIFRTKGSITSDL